MARGPLAEHESRRSIGRVLIMGGSESEAALLTRHFQRLGCAVEHVTSEKAVLEAARARIPDMIVINRQQSADTSVQQLIDELCDDPATAGCRIVVASGMEFVDVADTAEIHERGADDVLDRPYTQASIQRIIDSVESSDDRRGSTPDDISPL